MFDDILGDGLDKRVIADGLDKNCAVVVLGGGRKIHLQGEKVIFLFESFVFPVGRLPKK